MCHLHECRVILQIWQLHTMVYVTPTTCCSQRVHHMHARRKGYLGILAIWAWVVAEGILRLTCFYVCYVYFQQRRSPAASQVLQELAGTVDVAIRALCFRTTRRHTQIRPGESALQRHGNIKFASRLVFALQYQHDEADQNHKQPQHNGANVIALRKRTPHAADNDDT